MALFAHLLDLIFPPFCAVCGELGVMFCERCFSRVKFLQQQECPACRDPTPHGEFCSKGCKKNFALDGVIVAAEYDEILKRTISQWKYRFTETLGEKLSAVLISTLQSVPVRKNTMIVPVPLHPRRLRERGFNQSEFLAHAVAVFLHLPISHALKRIRNTLPQTKLKRFERLKNVIGAFEAAEKPSETILLIDDVSTTLSTLNECAKILKQSGAKTVFGATIARGL